MATRLAHRRADAERLSTSVCDALWRHPGHSASANSAELTMSTGFTITTMKSLFTASESAIDFVDNR